MRLLYEPMAFTKGRFYYKLNKKAVAPDDNEISLQFIIASIGCFFWYECETVKDNKVREYVFDRKLNFSVTQGYGGPTDIRLVLSYAFLGPHHSIRKEYYQRK